MLRERVIPFVSNHVRDHHPDHMHQYGVIFLSDHEEYNILMEELESDHDRIEDYVNELDRLECMFGTWMSNELKEEFLNSLDNMLSERVLSYRTIIRSVVASTANFITFIALCNHEQTYVSSIVKIIFDIRSEVFILEGIFADH